MIWKDVYEFEELYEISIEGIVRSKNRNANTRNGGKRFIRSQIIKQHLLKGYFVVFLNKDNKQHMRRVHRLLGFAFLNETYLEGGEINHKDLNKQNNKLDNLEWVNRLANMSHASLNGVFKEITNHKMGAKNNKQKAASTNPKRRKKLTPEQVFEIRMSTKNNTNKDLAFKFGVSQQTINKIVNYQMWKY